MKSILFLFSLLLWDNLSFAQEGKYPSYKNKQELIHIFLSAAKNSDLQMFFPVYIKFDDKCVLTMITTNDLRSYLYYKNNQVDTGRVESLKILKNVFINNDTLTLYSIDWYEAYKKYTVNSVMYDTLSRLDINMVMNKYLPKGYIHLTDVDEGRKSAIIYYMWQHNITMCMGELSVIELCVLNPSEENR